MTFDANDKKIEPGKRTAFHVYLEKTVAESKSQTVSFGCTLKKLSIYFDGNCSWTTIATVSIDKKVIARVRGDTVKLEYNLEEPIYPNSLVEFEITGTIPAEAQVNVYGVIECNGVTGSSVYSNGTSSNVYSPGISSGSSASSMLRSSGESTTLDPRTSMTGPPREIDPPPSNNSVERARYSASIRNGKLYIQK